MSDQTRRRIDRGAVASSRRSGRALLRFTGFGPRQPTAGRAIRARAAQLPERTEMSNASAPKPLPIVR
jgi:hypothetical protein